MKRKQCVRTLRSRLLIFLFCLQGFIPLQLSGNNVQVTNVTLTGQNSAQGYVLVQFDVSWDNSWRITTPELTNRDAVWIFVKFRKETGLYWEHATLHYVDGTGTGDGHTVPANAVIASSNDNGAGGAYGVFLYRSTDMAQGSVSYTNVQLRWDYSVDGVGNNDSVEVCVYAIEMVYVPQDTFYVGSGGNETRGFYAYPNSPNPYVITSEAALTMNVNGGLGSPLVGSATIPAAFPKGYRAFYCMKYEITQQQYVDFLNKLTPAQQSVRALTVHAPYRNGITYSVATGYTTSLPNVACNFLLPMDWLAYLDWAGLRPMTELEFEKACRGTKLPVIYEYAWGENTIANTAYTLSNAGAPNEDIATNYSTTVGNAAYFSTVTGTANGPLRVGIFAGNTANSGRTTSGGSFYGIMELSGNVREYTINVINNNARAYTGEHGNGELAANGTHDVPNWPTPSAAGSYYVPEIVHRGGGWRDSDPYLRVSDRTQLAYVSSTQYNRALNNWQTQNFNSILGGRGVRTAP